VWVDVIASVVVLARKLGLVVEEPVALRSTNNVLAWLRPSMVVAKISSRAGMAANELAIAKALSSVGAPVVPPASDVGDRLHRVAERDVTFWRYEPQDQTSSASSMSIAMALFDLHGALSTLASMLSPPTFDIQIIDAIHFLDNQDFAPELQVEDRYFLRQALNSGRETLAQIHDTHRIIHGSPHGMNILVVAGEPRFIDFETVQVGPLEWDLAHLEPEVADHYPAPLDVDTLAVCRLMVSATTSTWCWAGLERGPDMRSHAEHHLAAVRSALG
jgi:hypothetical protein